MKKFLKSSLVVVLLVIVAVCSTACGNSGSSLENYMNSSEMQSSINSVKQSMASSGIDVDVKADGNKLVYEYKYQKQMDIDAKVLESGLDSTKSTFENIAKTVGDALKTDISVVVKYLNADGSVITEREFTAK